MKTLNLFVLAAFLVFALAAGAQNSSNPAPSNTQSQSSNPSTSLSQSSEVNGNIVEGCVVQVEKDYFLQPGSGGNRMRLRGSHDFSTDVGHSIRAEGTVGPPGTNMASDTGNTSTKKDTASSNPANSQSPGSEQSSSTSNNASTPDFIVTRVSTVSQTCPANNGNSSTPGTMNNPH